MSLKSRCWIVTRLAWILRSDRGVETTLIAAAYHAFRKKNDPNISFSDCYRFGTSIANQRIEAWWGQLTQSLIFRWRGYFLRLSHDNLWSKDSLGDRIAFVAVYMPILRREIRAFTQL
ncbi:hypothetical protein VTO42DRAFT_1328 [Malbranchea cinnamomea]